MKLECKFKKITNEMLGHDLWEKSQFGLLLTEMKIEDQEYPVCVMAANDRFQLYQLKCEEFECEQAFFRFIAGSYHNFGLRLPHGHNHPWVESKAIGTWIPPLDRIDIWWTKQERDHIIELWYEGRRISTKGSIGVYFIPHNRIQLDFDGDIVTLLVNIEKEEEK